MIQLVFSVFILCPDQQLLPDCIVLINPSVAVIIIFCQIRKSIAGLGPKQFIAIINLSIAVFIKSQITAARIQPGYLIQYPVAVYIKLKFLIRYGRHIAVQVDHKGIACLYVVIHHFITLFIRGLETAAHFHFQVKLYFPSVCRHHTARGLERSTFLFHVCLADGR